MFHLGPRSLSDDTSFDDTTRIEANPDIAGVGVVAAFLTSAWLVFCLSTLAYISGGLPPHALNSIDTRVFWTRQRAWARPAFVATLEEAIVIISDQQLLTGISILVAGFAQITDLTGYHWQILTHLAWLSSSTHLATLTVLRERFRQKTSVRNGRVACMAVLLGMLMAASVLGWPFLNNPGLLNQKVLPTWQGKPGNYLDGAGPLSIFFLVLAFLWRLLLLFEWRPWGARSSKHPRKRAGRFFERLLRWCLRTTRHRPGHVPIWRRWIFRLVLCVYVHVIAITDIALSFAGSMGLLLLTLIWGTVAVNTPRASMKSLVDGSEDTWTFGQVFPLALLMQPLFAVLNYSWSQHAHQPVPSSGPSEETGYAGAFELQDQASQEDVRPLMSSIPSSALSVYDALNSAGVKTSCTGPSPLHQSLAGGVLYRTLAWLYVFEVVAGSCAIGTSLAFVIGSSSATDFEYYLIFFLTLNGFLLGVVPIFWVPLSWVYPVYGRATGALRKKRIEAGALSIVEAASM